MENQHEKLVALATKNIGDMVSIALEHDDSHKALVIYDTENELTEILAEAYRMVLPKAEFLDFSSLEKEEIIATFDALSPRDLVVLIQSSDFRLNEFRIRIHLFQQKLKVIDHQHLYRNEPDSWQTYINALAYDPSWYRHIGIKLKEILSTSEIIQFESGTHTLSISGGVEIPKLNIGDYTGMENIGGTFPIGEVFTEGKDLSRMNGSLCIYAFAGTDYHINMHEPFRVDIENGIVVGWADNTPDSFEDVVNQVKTNERALIREIGFGLNRAITRDHYLKDITAFERILGIHFSMGEKHTVYKKAGIVADKTRYHVDLFPVIDRVFADEKLIFENNEYLV
ncbi:MAG: hypothetical protein WAW13_01975 [Minisyncoccia bacterium]